MLGSLRGHEPHAPVLAQDTDRVVLLRASLVFERTLEDVLVTSQDYWAPDGDDFPTSGTNVYANLTDCYADLWTAVRERFPTNLTLREVRWYREDDDILPYGEVAVVGAIGSAGTASVVTGKGLGMLPGQVRCSITKETVHRKSWGRSYWPAFDRSQLATSGRWEFAAYDDLAVAYDACLERVHAETVWTPVVIAKGGLDGGIPPVPAGGKTLLLVKAVTCDDIPDVIRTGRPDMRLDRSRNLVALP